MKISDTKFPFELYSHFGSGVVIPAHCNEQRIEILEVVSGSAKIQIGTEYVLVGAGELVYIPEGAVACVMADEPTAVRGIIFDISIIEANMVNYETEILYMFYVQSENKIKVFGKDHPTYKILSKYMAEAHDEYAAKDVCYNLPIRADIYMMVTELLRYYCSAKNDLEKLVYHNVLRLRPVISYISEHYNEKIYIEKLAEIIMVSADYFTKMFKDSIGKTPVEYINGIRVNRAMKLLISTQDPMADIAAKTGFCNPNYFHKIFKQYMEVSPLAYRKANANSACND